MKRGSTIFLQALILLLGVGVLALLLWEPQVEGRNVHATQFEIYFKDPFLAYIYLAFVPFFLPGIQDIRVCQTKQNMFFAFCESFADHQVLRIDHGALYCRSRSLHFHLCTRHGRCCRRSYDGCLYYFRLCHQRHSRRGV